MNKPLRKETQTRLASPIFISYLKRGLRHTTDKEIAIQVGKMEGKAPIEFISLNCVRHI
jgi:hypothetical protein